MLKILRPAFLPLLLLVFIGHSVCKGQAIPGIPANELTLPPTRYEINFVWKGDTLHAQWEPYSALLLPVRLPNCPRQLYMQFDLGSPYSLFYGNKLKAIQAKYPSVVALTDSENSLHNYRFAIGDMPVLAKEITVRQFDASTINWADKNSMDIIGTLGTDFIDNRMVIIDYPKRKIITAPDISLGTLASFQLSDFVYAGRSVLLPSIIQGKKVLLYFDTGSSAFELLTDKKTVEALSMPNASLVQYEVSSWGKVLIAHTLATKDSVDIAFQRIPIRHASYMEGASSAKVEQMMKMGIGGMTGNKLFLHYKLLLDTKNKKFGLAKSSLK